MSLGLRLGLGLSAGRRGGAAAAPAVHPFTAMAVNADGYTLAATVGASKIGGTYANLNNQATPGLALTVSSVSWTTGGVQTTISRTVYATAVKRKPYNQQAVLEETTSGANFTTIYALSSKIYSGDTITACSIAASFFTDNGSGGSGTASSAQTPAVTNSSSQSYPAPVAMWLNHDRDRATSSAYSVGLTVAHRHFKSGQTVRAVEFIATDEHALSASVIVTAMSKITFTGSGLNASEYRGSIDLSTLTQGDLLTIDCKIYPWVGSAWQASVDGATYPSPNMTTLRVLNDKTGAYGTAYAYVDGVGGSPAVSTNPVTAATTPYSTVALAAAAIKTFNNSNFSRNNASGGIIRLTATTHTHGTFGTVGGGVIPLVIEAANVANKATTILTDSGASIFNGFPNYTKLKDIKLQKNGAGSVVAFSSGGTTTSAHALTIQNCVFDLNGKTDYAGWILDVGQVTLINCTGDMPNTGAYIAGNSKMINAWGCDTVGFGSAVYNICGNKSLNALWNGGPAAISQFQAPTQTFAGWCFLGQQDGGNHVVARDLSGLALIGNVFEQRGTTTQPLLQANDSGTNTSANFIDIANTGVGGRLNAVYNDGASASSIAGDGISALSVWDEANSKGDVFATNGACIGNWPYRYRPDSFYRTTIRGDTSDAAPGPSSWLGELAARGDVNGVDATPIVVAWVSDQSTRGGNAGNGNYKPNAGSTALNQVPAGLTAFPFDLNGTAVPTNGTAYVGALQA